MSGTKRKMNEASTPRTSSMIPVPFAVFPDPNEFLTRHQPHEALTHSLVQMTIENKDRTALRV
jgi:hypothetical protein